MVGREKRDYDGDAWGSPEPYVTRLHRFRPIVDLDPCSTFRSIVHSRVAYMLPQSALLEPLPLGAEQVVFGDGLELPWWGSVHLNPPYSAPARWMRRAADEALSGRAETTSLVKADLSTRWWGEYVWHASAICIPSKRLAYIPPSGATAGQSNFGSAIPYFGNDVQGFVDSFSDLGRVLRRDAGWTP